MKEFNAISYFDTDDYESVIEQIQKMNYKIYHIDGRNISTMEEFFGFIKDTFPLDPPLSGRVNFDAFADSFSTGIDQSEYARVAIVFEKSEEFIKEDKFDVFVRCMEDITCQLVQEDYWLNKKTVLRTFLFGNGARFSRICD